MHYVFNRDYLVLPFQLPFLLLQAAVAIGFHRRPGTAGHGRFKPEVKDPNEWYTVFFFNDDCPPVWQKRTRDYDKDKYL